MDKPKIKETIVVEGKYDKIKLSSIVEANIVVTNGFSVFRNKETLSYIRKMANINGIVLLTDSDRAGFLIRNYVKQGISPQKVKQAYIPDIAGKEKRKSLPSKAGTLGVEGMDPQTILHALKSAGCTFFNEAAPLLRKAALSKADLFLLGLSGSGSRERRAAICRKLSLPVGLSSKAFLEAINILFTKEELEQFLLSNHLIEKDEPNS